MYLRTIADLKRAHITCLRVERTEMSVQKTRAPTHPKAISASLPGVRKCPFLNFRVKDSRLSIHFLLPQASDNNFHLFDSKQLSILASLIPST